MGEDLASLGRTDVPALILWGADDPVFLDRYLDDLRDRLPHARVQRYERAGHLLVDDRDITAPLLQWAQLLRGGQLSDPASGLPGPVPHATTDAAADPGLEVDLGEEPGARDPGVVRLWDHLRDWGAPGSDHREYTALVDMAGAQAGRSLVGTARRPVACLLYTSDAADE